MEFKLCANIYPANDEQIWRTNSSMWHYNVVIFLTWFWMAFFVHVYATFGVVVVGSVAVSVLRISNDIVFVMKSNWSNYGIRFRGPHCCCCCCRRYLLSLLSQSIFSWCRFLFDLLVRSFHTDDNIWYRNKWRRRAKKNKNINFIKKIVCHFFCFNSYTQCHCIKLKKKSI